MISETDSKHFVYVRLLNLLMVIPVSRIVFVQLYFFFPPPPTPTRTTIAAVMPLAAAALGNGRVVHQELQSRDTLLPSCVLQLHLFFPPPPHPFFFPQNVFILASPYPAPQACRAWSFFGALEVDSHHHHHHPLWLFYH